MCSTFGKMGKYRLFESGGSKNQNKCSVFQAAYKLVHLYTNFILKSLNKNLIKSSKIKHFTNFNPKSQYRTQYRQTPLKSTLTPIPQPKSKLTIQITFFLYKYKNHKKIHTFTDYQFFTKFIYKSTLKLTSNFSYLTFISHI